VAILGPDELAQGLVTIKDLNARSQVSVPRGSVADEIVQRLAQPVAA
jgi:histidyl-tRNA synthetase